MRRPKNLFIMIFALIIIPSIGHPQIWFNDVPNNISFFGRLTRTNNIPYPPGLYIVHFSLKNRDGQVLWGENHEVEIQESTESEWFEIYFRTGRGYIQCG